MINMIFVYVLLNQINLSHGDGSGHSNSHSNDHHNGHHDGNSNGHVWDFIKDFPGTHNCPRCKSVPECYAECDKDHMKEFINIATWSECKDLCQKEGALFSYEFDTPNPDRACAMHSQKDQGICICVEGHKMACKDIDAGFENCPKCGNGYYSDRIIGGAPECLYECDWDHMREFIDIGSWGECKKLCQSLGDDFDYRFGSAYNDRACGIYARYDIAGIHGKCVCVEGKHNACENSIWEDAPPAILGLETSESLFDMIEGYGIGVVSTLIILLIGIFIAYICRKWTHISAKRAGSVEYAKVINVDETTDDERVVIKQ